MVSITDSNIAFLPWMTFCVVQEGIRKKSKNSFFNIEKQAETPYKSTRQTTSKNLLRCELLFEIKKMTKLRRGYQPSR